MTWLDDFLTSKWPGSFTALAPPLSRSTGNVSHNPVESSHYFLTSPQLSPSHMASLLLSQYQIILPGDKLHMHVNNLPGWESNCQSLDHKSNCSTMPPASILRTSSIERCPFCPCTAEFQDPAKPSNSHLMFFISSYCTFSALRFIFSVFCVFHCYSIL